MAAAAGVIACRAEIRHDIAIANKLPSAQAER
jgi:hypothetical protein